jgi:hypothetical protein
MAEERLSYTDTLARLDERMSSVERRLDQPMRCVEGALVAQRLDQMAEALKDLVAIREEDRRAIAAHERRLQALEDGVQIRVAQITAIAAIVGGSVTVLGQLVLKAITRG